jgi:N-acetylglucosamine kinase-like BadF-type ATPase
VVLAALQAIARAADGRGPATRLTEQFLSRLRLGKPADLIPTVYRGGWDRTALAGLAPLVLETAEAGDAVASAIVNEATRQLAEMAVAVARQILPDSSILPVALTGGVLLSAAGYRQRFLQALAASGVQPAPVTLVREPAEGAVRMALQPDQAQLHNRGR